MRVLRLLLVCAILLSVFFYSSVFAQEPDSKLDTKLRRLLIDTEEGASPLAEGQTVDVILLSSGNVAGDLAALGARVRTVIGGPAWITTADLPIRSLRQAASLPAVTGLQSSRRLYPRLDKSLLDAKIDQVWQLSHNGMPVRGKGVVIGVVDSGIDWKLDDFKDEQGKTRLLGIWDQEAGEGTPPDGYNYGNFCSRDAIDAAQCSQIDSNGHGTHVAGIAGGDGGTGAGVKYVGVAPESELIIVKSNFEDSKAIDAWNFIVQRARALNRPVVINNSFGGHGGPHDGTAALERAIDQLSGPGVVFVVAAGNEGDSPIHAEGTLAQGQEVTTTYQFPEPSSQSSSSVVVWYEGADSMSLTVKRGEESYGPVAEGETKDFQTPDGIKIQVDTRPQSGNSSSHAGFTLQWPDGEKGDGSWSFVLRGDTIVAGGRWDAWLPTGKGAGSGTEVFTSNSTAAMTVGEPGNAQKAVVVASYTTRDCWQTAGGERCYDPKPAVGQISAFSSIGPTRDGRQKPDLAAPGEAVIASLSGDLGDSEKPSADDVAESGVHYKQQGTSMAAPHVAGVIALMLQINPQLEGALALDILRSMARGDQFTGAGPAAASESEPWKSTWGRGKLDALASVNDARLGVRRHFAQFGNGSGITSTLILINASADQTVDGYVLLSGPSGAPLTVNINDNPVTGRFDFTLTPRQVSFFSTDGGGELLSGSVRIAAAGPVAGTILFSGGFGVAGVGSASPAGRFVVPIEMNTAGGIATGLALSNAGTFPAAATVRLRRGDGSAVDNGAALVQLAPGGQLARFPGELLDGRGIDLSDFRGSLEVEAPVDISGMAVRVSPGEFATLPVASEKNGKTTLQFAQFGNGSGLTSTIILVNFSAAETAAGTVRIFDSSGNPLVVTINGTQRQGTFEFSIPPLGVAFFASDGAGAITTGSVEATSNLPLGGTILFGGSIGVAGVGGAEPLANFVMPLEMKAAAGISTGVALSNPTAAAVDVTVRLFRPDGSQVASVNVNLPARGQLARFPNEIFAGVDFSNFRGTVAVSSPVPVVGMAVRVSPGQFATLPVTALE